MRLASCYWVLKFRTQKEKPVMFLLDFMVLVLKTNTVFSICSDNAGENDLKP